MPVILRPHRKGQGNWHLLLHARSRKGVGIKGLSSFSVSGSKISEVKSCNDTKLISG